MHQDNHRNGRLPLALAGAVFVGVICAIIFALSGWWEWSARTSRLRAAEIEMSNVGRLATQHAEDSLDLLGASIVGVVLRIERDGVGPETLATLHEILALRKTELKRLHGLVICDENGNWLASSGAMGSNLSSREYFRRHRESVSRDALIGNPIRSDIDGDWIITLSRRFNHPDGSFGGVVLATIGSDYFSDFYRKFNIGAHGIITLMSTGGIVMARSIDNGAFVGYDTSKTSLFKTISSLTQSGVLYFTSPLDGLDRLGFYQRSSHFPLTVMASMQTDEILAPWREAAIARMAFVLALTSMIAGIGFFLVQQVSGRQRMAAALASKEASFRLLAEGSSDMVTRIGLDGRISYASPSALRIVGWSPDQLIGTPALAGVHPLDLRRVKETAESLRLGRIEEARVAYRTRRRDRSEVWIEATLRVTRTTGGEIDGVVAVSRDVTEQKALEERLAILATHDGLTGLFNRRSFDDRLLAEWSRACRDGTTLSILMIDVDHFKKFNDQYGHPAGDQCLRSVARILASEIRRASDLAARYGGEEFAILLPNTDAAGCATIGQKIRRALEEAGMSHAQNLPSRRVTVSIGGASSRPDMNRSNGPAGLVEAADRALYAAKGRGRDQLVMAGEVVHLPLASSAARQ